MTRLTPARLLFEGDTPISADFGDVYHAMDGGLEQCQHVFLEGNRLPDRWKDRKSFQILELGFGAGLNFLATWNAWRHSKQAPGARLHFVSLEQFPLAVHDLGRILRRYPTIVPLAQALQDAWPLPIGGFHAIDFDAGQVRLTLVLGDVQRTLPDLAMAADAVFLDGFSPAKNPAMWSEPVLRLVARQCRPQATLATWCVAGNVRRCLSQQGFTVQRRPGFGRKRERLEATFDRIPDAAFLRMVTPRRNRALHSALSPPPARHAIIVGAGLGGCLMSERLATLGWQVDLFDRHPGPAAEASGNPAGIWRPVLSRDDNLSSRLSRAGFFHTRSTLERLQHEGVLRSQARGVLVLSSDAAQADRQRRMFAENRWPEAFASYVEQDRASHLAGLPLPSGGEYFPSGGWIDPVSYCQAALQASGAGVRCHWQVSVAALRRSASAWEVMDSDGHVRASAPIVILALGARAQTLAQTAELPLESFRGQLTQIDHDPLPSSAPVLCQEGYLIPGLPEGLCIGATFDRSQNDLPSAEDHRKNLAHLQRLLPAWSPSCASFLERVGFRSVSRDRMPVVGPLPGQPGLHVVMGLGSRGLVLASLLADVIGSLLEGFPLPLESTLLRAIAPERFQ